MQLKIKISKYGLSLLLISISLLMTTGCRKFVEVEPPITYTTGDNAFKSDPTAIGVLNGIYTKLNKGFDILGTPGNFSFALGLLSDDFILSGNGLTPRTEAYFKNALRSNVNESYGGEAWEYLYPVLYTCNSAIESLSNGNELTPAVKKQLLGESKFLRAFCYFYLVNLYGDVPLVLTTDYKVNSVIKRSPKQDVYEQIIIDLKESQLMLSDSYLKGDAITPYTLASTERVRPTRNVASALLARVYLYIGDYLNAESEANILIGNNSLYSLTDLETTFKKNSLEAIWQLPSTSATENYTIDGYVFILPESGPNELQPIVLSDTLLRSFNVGDQRRQKWIDSIEINGTFLWYPGKYKENGNNTSGNEYLMILRLGEQYLIRAEARIMLGKIDEGITDLNSLRSRATDKHAPTTERLIQIPFGISKEQALQYLENERQHELFSEWGHRWLDLKRTNRLNYIMGIASPKKGGIWEPNQSLFPIPFGDMDKNQSLQQNPGY